MCFPFLSVCICLPVGRAQRPSKAAAWGRTTKLLTRKAAEAVDTAPEAANAMCMVEVVTREEGVCAFSNPSSSCAVGMQFTLVRFLERGNYGLRREVGDGGPASVCHIGAGEDYVLDRLAGNEFRLSDNDGVTICTLKTASNTAATVSAQPKGAAAAPRMARACPQT